MSGSSRRARGAGPLLQGGDHLALGVQLEVELLLVEHELLADVETAPPAHHRLVEPGDLGAGRGVDRLHQVEPLLRDLARVGALLDDHRRLAVLDDDDRLARAAAGELLEPLGVPHLDGVVGDQRLLPGREEVADVVAKAGLQARLDLGVVLGLQHDQAVEVSLEVRRASGSG